MMAELKFDRKYYPLILDGLKTQTLRKKEKDLHVGDHVRAVFPGVSESLVLEITHTGFKALRTVNTYDVEREGYDCLSDLKNDLVRFYPDINPWNRLYYYRFKLVEE